MRFTNARSKCFVQMLQPTTVEHSIIPGFVDRNGITYAPTAVYPYDDCYRYGAFRTEFWPNAATTQPSFLTVLLPAPVARTDAQVPAMERLTDYPGDVGGRFPDDK